MAAILYDEILPELQEVADRLEESEIQYRAFNKGYQFNAMDLDGVWHSFYPTTGTVILNASNDRKDHRRKTFYDKSLDTFIKGMKTNNLTKHYFKEDF